MDDDRTLSQKRHQAIPDLKAFPISADLLTPVNDGWRVHIDLLKDLEPDLLPTEVSVDDYLYTWAAMTVNNKNEITSVVYEETKNKSFLTIIIKRDVQERPKSGTL
jgi:hypothetical protein